MRAGGESSGHRELLLSEGVGSLAAILPQHADAVALAAIDRLAAAGGARSGAVGFSMGAAWALWGAAERPAVAASVVHCGSIAGPSLARSSVPMLGHFAEPSRDAWRPEAADLAFERTVAFLREQFAAG